MPNNTLNTTTTHILAVDDEPDVQDLYKEYFRREIKQGKYTFLFATDGRQALDMLKDHPEISVVLADINMPGMDGLTLLNMIHQESFLDQRYQFVKVIMVTAYGDMPNIRKSLNFGAFDFLTKPIKFDDMEITINKTLQAVGELRGLYEKYKAEEQRRITAEQKLAEINSVLTGSLTPGGSVYGRL